MEEQNRKIGFVVSAEDDTKTTFQNIKTGAADMAASVAKSGEQAAKGVKGIGDGADEAAQKMGRAESAMAQALTRATEKAKIAAQAGESLSRAFEQKIEMRGLDATKLNPLVAKLREAEDALASFKAQQAKDAGQSSFLESLRSQTLALGKTKSELLELQAAQLGVASQAAPLIAKLREAETGVGRVGNTAAQTAAAMRMVPAQFTDIVVSLQAGQAPLTVLLQQGGQLKDMFGTTGAAARGLASYVAGLVSPYTAAGAAVAILGLAYYQGSKESDAFRKSILLTGNQAGVTVDQLNTMARAMADVVGTQGVAAAGLAQMARDSKVGADSLQEFTTVAIQWEKATGQAVKDTAKQFAELAKDPLKASLALNEEMNHLTASVYDQIKALDKQGKTAEAAAVAQKAYADAMSSRRAEMVQNLGYIEAGWNKVKTAAKKAWDAILDIGREGTAEQKLASVQSDLQAAERQLANAERAAFGGSRASKAEEERRRAAVEDLRAQEKSLRDGIAAGQKKAAEQVASKDYVDAMQAFDQVAGQFASKEVKRKQELTLAQNLYNEAVEKTKKALADSPELGSKLAKLEADYGKTVAGINKKFTEKASGGGINVTENQLAGLEAKLAAARQYREQLLTLGAAASDLNEGERESIKLAAQIERTTNAKTRAKLEEAKSIADAWGAQVRSNEELHKSQKAYESLIAGNYKAADSLTERAKEQEAANVVFGKGRTEIERMTLATLQQQMAEAQGSDSFDPKYIASLEAKIAAQKRWVAALQQADFKQMDDRLSKSLQASKDELAIQKEGLSLLGADEVQRKKIIAQRRIELELSREIAAIDNKKFSDDKEENDAKRAELRGKAREKAEIDTQIALGRIQEEYVTKQVEQYDEIFRKGFADMLNNGRDGWDSFTKSLTTTFKTTVADQIYKMFLRPFVVQVVASLIGVQGGGGGGLGGVGGTGASGGGFGGGIPGLGLLGESGLFAGTNFGAGLMGGMPALSGGIEMMMGGELLAGGMQAFGAALPYLGAAIAVFSLLKGAFGSRGPNHSGGVASTATKDRDQAAKQALGVDAWGNTLGDFTSRGNPELDKQLDLTVNGMLDMYKSLAKFSKTAVKDLDIAAGFSVNPKYGDEGAMGFFQLIDKSTGEILKRFKDRELDKDPQKAWAQFVGEMGGALIDEIKKGDIPGWMRSELDALGDNVTVEGLNQALLKIAAIDAAFKGWGDTMTGFAGISEKAQTELLKLSGGLEALASNVNAFYAGFYSEAERAEILQRQVRDQLKKLGVVDIDPAGGEEAKKKFRKLIEDALASGNTELAAKLLALAQLFGVAADYAQKSAETAAEAAKTAADEAVKALEESRKKAKEAAYANFEAAIQREQAYWQDVASASQEAISSLSSALSTLKSNARDLYGSLDATQQMLAAQGMVYIEDALSGVRGGRKLTDYAGLTDAIGAARGGINSGRYATQFEKERDALILAGQLTELADKGDAQLSVEERQLKNSQEQLERLDKTLGYWRDLLDGNKAQIDATLSVEAAIKALEALLFPEKPPAAGGGSGSGKTPTPDWGGGGGGGFQPANSGKYKTPTAILGGGAVIYDYADADYSKKLDGLSSTFHKYDGTGDFAGLADDFRAAGGTAKDLAYLYGFSEADVLAALDRNGIPRFEAGGMFAGGLRMVGERGPELEVTGPARYWSSAQTQALLSGAGGNARLESLVEQLVAENRLLRGQIAALERNTAGMPQMAEQFDTVAESGVLRVGTV
ncbi:phage tail length tape measure family protein [Delftia tsuruhatensis]|uniref:phage tail length tape measure family protein n=1 Tax=Delftia tsuruhatensis TaxID=180282 RepID=UPI002443CA50|nr:phage tail length tape measure family protein [Delftia tsuruhatensis]MDH0776329.1 phage tail length tape measure family protein [Delftia tsuruhatensis]MDH1460116.1 phage tail length tape measure family protein [Delftia tsuruhatensis]MDH1823079.1 phage tail length tape measure family protein [Delftia tsuruhatensis]WGG12284.1 phage tail length tape measure family protein [Delftia tsuruhatensis]